jgi:hypothetical protein
VSRGRPPFVAGGCLGYASRDARSLAQSESERRIGRPSRWWPECGPGRDPEARRSRQADGARALRIRGVGDPESVLRWRKTDAQTSAGPTSSKGVDKRPFRNRSHPTPNRRRHRAWTPLDTPRSRGLGRAARATPRGSGPGSRPGDPARRCRDRNRAGEGALVRRARIPRLDRPPLSFTQTAPWRPGRGRRPLTGHLGRNSFQTRSFNHANQRHHRDQPRLL